MGSNDCRRRIKQGQQRLGPGQAKKECRATLYIAGKRFQRLYPPATAAALLIKQNTSWHQNDHGISQRQPLAQHRPVLAILIRWIVNGPYVQKTQLPVACT
ncbi:hypothetical protein GCM10011317_37430 [Niveispirillum cyanobacteriorum]|nr:hypothetical protein GCM10011317_37430 [Niveispirillum cyanobacteriorum]